MSSSVSSFFTPSIPILSSLSSIINTALMSFSSIPLAFTRALSIFLSLILRVNLFLGQSFESTPVVASISSISAAFVASPSMSISHCVNCLNLPFCGLSALHTEPIWSDLKGLISLSLLLA